MKKTFNVDEKLLRQAREACGAATYTETIDRGLRALMHHWASQELRKFFGTEPGAKDVPRRREPPARKRRRAG